MRYAVYITPHTVPSSVANLLDALHSANRHAGRTVFETVLVAERAGTFGRDGVRLEADGDLRRVRHADGIIVPAVTASIDEIARDCPRFLANLPRWVAAGKSAASACTGALVLALAGVLDGRVATTHWSAERSFRRAFPQVRLRFAALIERDGPIITSGGGTAGIDLALALVEATAGGAVARRVAAGLVFDHRRGPQSVYFPLTPPPTTDDVLVARARAAIHERLGAEVRVTALAARLAVSSRTLLRRFQLELGLTPAAYVQRARLDAARVKLETTHATIEAIVESVGYVDRASFGRSFKRHFGVSPAAFRSRRGVLVAPTSRSGRRRSRRSAGRRRAAGSSRSRA